MSESGTRPAAELIHDPGWIRLALVLWMVLALAVSIKTLVSPVQHTVFPKLSARAVNWWSGQPLYEQYEGLGRFPYPPVFAIGLTPFALLGDRIGGILWILASIGVYVCGLRRLTRDVLPGDWPAIKVGAFLVLAMLGAVRGLWNAQSNALIIGLLMLGVAAAARRHWWRAALLLAAPACIKVWPLVIGLLLAVRFPGRLAWRLPVAVAIGGLLPFLTQPYAVVLAQYAGWLKHVSEMSAEVVGSYRDLWTVLALLSMRIEQPVYRIVQAATGLAVVGWCLWQSRGVVPDFRFPLLDSQGRTALESETGNRKLEITRRWQLTAILAMGSAWLMVLGPAVEYNTFVVLAPSAAWALLAANETRNRFPFGFLLALAAYLTTMLLGAGSLERAVAPHFPWVLLTLPVGAMLFILWLVVYGRRCGSAAPAESPVTAVG